MDGDVLDRFSPATAAWFRGSFSAPTPAQAGAWEAISGGHHALVVAPTGSGKTLAAFLWALDRLASRPVPAERLRRCRVLYVSPMKALAVDVERNLRSPLVGIRHAAARLGLPEPETTVAVRSGDTPADERRAFARTPSDILITTPESLFLLLTSAAREALTGVETVVLDEVHALAGTKRGAHLALSLERLDALLPAPAQRIGLSATVRPVEEVGRFLAGGRPVEVVQPPAAKEWDLRVVVPVPDMSELGQPTGDLAGAAAGPERRASIWPHVEERIVDLVAEHTSTLVFANSRRLAERLTSRLNEIWQERLEAADGDAAVGAPGADPRPATLAAAPAQVMAQSGRSAGAAPVIARAHHGSVSKEHRGQIEEELKSGRLPAVVATSSLELGIDMGAVDLVVQVESPPSVASGLQRVGRAGHQVGAVSRGVLFPKFRGDLVQTAVVVERMLTGSIEALRVPQNPLDVLAQQVVAMCALEEWGVEDLLALARRSAPYATLTRPVLESVLDMLAGRYPSEDFAELRARLTWDRLSDTLVGRRGAQRLAVTSGGTIPDRGLYGVFLATGEGPGRRVGELDEEMVYESRVGDLFTLGTSTWRIEDITHDRVLVTPAPGLPGRLPFWKGDSLGRPAELGRAVGEFVREVGALSDDAAHERVMAAGLDAWAAENLLTYLREQREATGHLPDDRTVVVERFRDELGDWRIAVHSPFGAQVHAPWALALSARMRDRFGVDVQAMHGDDGIVLRLPDLEWDDVEGLDRRGVGRELLELVTLDPEQVRGIVTDEIGGSALFASRFRECAARALLLPRRRPDRRQPLWQQRQRASQLLEVASRFPTFPIVLEAVRECVQDVFDVPGLTELMRDVAARRVTVVEVESATPSPFAASLLFGYVAQFLYEGDTPLAERRAAALALDPGLLAELLGGSEGLALRDLLDAEQVARTEAELQRLTPERAARDGDDVLDLLRALGPLSVDAVLQRCREGVTGDDVEAWLGGLEAVRQVIPVRVAGEERWAAVEDASRLRDALGASLPPGVAQTFLEPVADPLGDLVARYARTHAPFRPAQVAQAYGLGVAVVAPALARLVASGRVVEGELLPTGGGGTELCDAEVLRTLRRRSLAALRAEVEPVPPEAFGRFLAEWQGVGGRLRGRDGVLRVVEQLSGAVLPASAVESLVLPARVADYSPALLDELLASGEVLWAGHGSLPGDDGWVSLHVADSAQLTLPGPDPDQVPDEDGRALLDALAGGGGHFFRGLADRLGSSDDEALATSLWGLVWSGRVTGDTFAPVRALLAGGRTAHRRAASGPRRTRYGGRRGPLGALGSAPTRPALPLRSGPPRTTGRWSLLSPVDQEPTLRALATAELLLDRYGVVTRGAVAAEDVPGGFAGVYRVYGRAEESGRVRRGYFVEGLGASQFGTSGAIDRLRAGGHHRGGADAVVLAASDPANPYGAALPWPERVLDTAPEDAPEGRRRRHQAGRKAGAVVVLVGGLLALYVERGGRTLLTYSDDVEVLTVAATALGAAVRQGHLGRVTVERADGDRLLGSDHPVAAALEAAGFHLTPRGLRMRR
ncbi:ATP-dependent helicase [Phycicoccus endophyticus]|uniref:ATP-dependent helicase n=1 Tax=Phycicoccus endophyticus TaxID=1690220 RepID=A0A7G9R3S2_9MICO|nr:ATP-dependent helicase [Phycicoccus endophyticus]NHI18071.1 ATP-dependent helicase [Phycicoccus endophyticus]QNN50247.1 ATP-dependent helicase [Phycicoccus endophyticus]GGL26689.1 DEAD/DEAH box helicase [Phycicoccus endophyticus]